MNDDKNQDKEKSLYESYMENAYLTLYIPEGRDLNGWSKEQKMAELKKLLKEFKEPNGSSPRTKTYILINEIFDSSPIPASKIDGNVDEIILEYNGWKNSVYQCMDNNPGEYYYSVEKEFEGPKALAKMIDYFEKYSD